MNDRIKKALFEGGKRLGLFGAAQLGAKSTLRILGYHGFEMGLERAFRPKLFIDPAVFKARILSLKRMGFDILDLGEAVDRLSRGALPPNPVVITIDDGFYGTYRYGIELMRELQVPMTVYVTSYYVTHPNPIFGLAVQYMMWKTSARTVDLGGLGLQKTGVVPVSEALASEICAHGENTLDEPGRVDLARELGVRLGVSYEALEKSRALSLMTTDEIAQLAKAGFDVQLHTHRHRLRFDPREVQREIDDNRAVLEPLVGKKLVHFCYPADTWEEADRHASALASAGIASATTDAPGLARKSTPRLALPRFLDSGDIDQVAFEAEMTGLMPFLRDGVQAVRQRVRRPT